MPPKPKPQKERIQRGGILYSRYLEARRRGATWDDMAKIFGISYQTVARAFKDMREMGMLEGDDGVEGGGPPKRRIELSMSAQEQRAVLVEALNDEMAQGGSQAVQSIKVFIDLLQKHEVESAYGSAREAEARFVVRQRAAALGRELRERATTDARLHELYYAAARTDATEDMRNALAVYLERKHADVLSYGDPDQEENDAT